MSEPLMLLPLSATGHAPAAKKRGHAARPGTGPAGETCGSCHHIAKRRLGKAYTKCGLTQANWTGGGGSDVRHKDPACSFWKAAADAR